MHGAIKKRLRFDPCHWNIESGRRKLIATRRARANDEYYIGAPRVTGRIVSSDAG